ncbi:MAG: exodeoxyribonuclease VII small subunit [Candidatus Omnitrophica bacterium]|nr:exodeoxyribonuclease VII small subunit [Candidatus Omnitrophota bacterium]
MAEIKFEEALKKLEGIVADLEGGDLSLDDSLTKYEDGIKLSILCTRRLEAAKKKVETLIKSKDGTYSLKPFDESGLDDIAIKKGRTRRPKKDKEENLFE